MISARLRLWIAVAAAGAIWLAMMLAGGRGSGWDLVLHEWLYAGDNVTLARNSSWFTQLGSGLVLTILALLAMAILIVRRRMRAAVLLIMVFGGRFLVELQKLIISRPRVDVSPHLEMVTSPAFPSGHAANSMITFLAIGLLLPVRQRYRAIAVGIGLALSLQVGASRVILGVHWPSDVIGGWAFGITWVMICMYLASARPEADTPNDSS
jgi:undecaprenyl-diphosphatase